MLENLLSEGYAGILMNLGRMERTATPVRVIAVCLPETGCSLRETIPTLAELGGEHSHGAVWNWVHRL
jgi:putative transposase